MKVIIETIPHAQQPYDTVGDWRFEDGSGNPISQSVALLKASVGLGNECVLRIRVSDLKSWKYEMLVAVHELVETLLCMDRGVMVEDVDKFDKAFEKKRKPGDESEPGDDPRAPYVKEHCIATSVERLLCAELGCSWKVYNKKVMSL